VSDYRNQTGPFLCDRQADIKQSKARTPTMAAVVVVVIMAEVVVIMAEVVVVMVVEAEISELCWSLDLGQFAEESGHSQMRPDLIMEHLGWKRQRDNIA
jgi:hypothetical protein